MLRKTPLSNILIGALLLAIFGMGFFVAYLSLKLSKVFVKTPVATPNAFILATPKPLNDNNPEKNVYNILLMGYGGGNHDGALLTDSMIVTHIDMNTKKISFISVPRDIWTSGNQKINAVATYNGFSAVGPAITSITGLPINYFVSVDFSGFSKIIDDLGGVSIQVPKTFDDPFYPILGQENNVCGMTNDEINALKTQYSGYDLETKFTCRYEHLHFDQGPATLDGATALKFVRSRHGDSDFGRSLRQFAVLQGISSKLISFQALGKLNDIINTISQIVQTNLDAGSIKTLISVAGDSKSYTFKQIQLTTDNVLNQGTASDGEFILYPKSGMSDFTSVKNYIKSNLTN